MYDTDYGNTLENDDIDDEDILLNDETDEDMKMTSEVVCGCWCTWKSQHKFLTSYF